MHAITFIIFIKHKLMFKCNADIHSHGQYYFCVLERPVFAIFILPLQHKHYFQKSVLPHTFEQGQLLGHYICIIIGSKVSFKNKVSLPFLNLLSLLIAHSTAHWFRVAMLRMYVQLDLSEKCKYFIRWQWELLDFLEKSNHEGPPLNMPITWV